MIGAIIGDIVGSRFEFNNHRSTSFELFTPGSTFTDDTICTVAVAAAMLHNHSFEESLVKWCSKYPNPAGGYGILFKQWLINGKGPYNSYGNGSAMRVSPVAWIATSENNLTFEEVIYNAKRSAKITHNHPEGIKGAQCVAGVTYRALQMASKEEIREFVISLGYNLDFTCQQIRTTNHFDETCQVTVPQAIVCFLESHDFESAIRLAVSIGGDSDTIACITGGIAEAYYKEIPPTIIKQARRRLPAPILKIIDEFYNRTPYGYVPITKSPSV